MPLVGLLIALVASVGVLAGCAGSETEPEPGPEAGRTDRGDQQLSDGDSPPADDGSGPPGEVEELTDADGVVAEDQPIPDGESLVVALAAEPADLHIDAASGGLPEAAWIREGLLESLFGVGSDLTHHPELLADEPTLTTGADGSITIDYRLRPGLSWSDGTPLTADDVAYTHRLLTEGCQVEFDGSIVDGTDAGCLFAVPSRAVIDQVTDFNVSGETEFSVTMATYSPDWRSLYSPVLAEHAHGADALEANRLLASMSGPSGPLPSSGPLRLVTWDRGRSMTLAANTAYHGSVAPGFEEIADDGGDLQRFGSVIVVFEPDVAARLDGLAAGEVDLLFERARPEHEALISDPGVTTVGFASPQFEHWGLNLLNPHLAQPSVREAIAFAIDKEAIVTAVYQPLVGSNPAPVALGNTYWMVDQPDYVDHQERYAGAQVASARQALAGAGYVTGPTGSLEHPELGPLRLRVSTTGGDPVRESAQALMIEQLEAVGITAVADNLPGGRFFREGPFDPEALAASGSAGVDGDATLWDIAQFAWVGRPWPGGQSGAYRSGSLSNPYGFSNLDFQQAASACDAETDEAAQSRCYNDLDRYVTTLDLGPDGLFMIPLVQRPHLMAWTARLAVVPGAAVAVGDGPFAAFTGFATGPG
jgi:peptide/nickel transport system substrate-binding protein